MLKYNIRIDNKMSSFYELNYERTEVHDLGDANPEKFLVTCYLSDDYKIKVGEEISVLFRFSYIYQNDSKQIYDTFKKYYVVSVDNNEKTFNLLVDKYLYLDGFYAEKSTERIYIDDNYEEYETKTYITFIFNEPHRYNVYGLATPIIYVERNVGGVITTYALGFGVSESEGEDEEEDSDLGFVVSDKAIRFPYVGKVVEAVDGWFEETEDDTSVQTYNLAGEKIYRSDYIFNSSDVDGELTLYTKGYVASLNLPLSVNVSYDLYQENLIKERFVGVEKQKAINNMSDMEKDVYYPSISTDGYQKICKKMTFNFHFRERNGDGWTTTSNNYWNGTYLQTGSGGKPALALCVSVPGTPEGKYGFFSSDDKDSQSDLLGYLNFTNSDIKYHKNRLTKSFFRFLFYDSPYYSNQNLLSYSTVNFDVGLLYGKMMRNASSNGDTLSFTQLNEDFVNIKNLEGLNTYREPYDPPRALIADAETCRLSSRITLTDRNSSDNSSEGFYLYLWKDNFLGEEEQDIYLRVEFNHAGYGTTVPFMLPYVKTGGKKRAMSFSDIAKKMTDSMGEDGSGGVGGFNINDYIDYSYIHLKYRYDKETKKHVYYPDPKTYGTSLNGVDELIINLYEAKVR